MGPRGATDAGCAICPAGMGSSAAGAPTPSLPRGSIADKGSEGGSGGILDGGILDWAREMPAADGSGGGGGPGGNGGMLRRLVPLVDGGSSPIWGGAAAGAIAGAMGQPAISPAADVDGIHGIHADVDGIFATGSIIGGRPACPACGICGGDDETR